MMEKRKKLILVSAPPASGKTYTANRIADRIGDCAWLDKDDLFPLVKTAFDVTGEPFTYDGEYYRQEVRSGEYETLLRLAVESLAHTRFVLVNAPLGLEIRSPERMREIKAAANGKGADLVLVWVLSTPESIRKRMISRGAERDRAKLQAFDAYVAGINLTPPVGLLAASAVDAYYQIDNTSDEAFEDTLDAAIQEIRK